MTNPEDELVATAKFYKNKKLIVHIEGDQEGRVMDVFGFYALRRIPSDTLQAYGDYLCFEGVNPDKSEDEISAIWAELLHFAMTDTGLGTEIFETIIEKIVNGEIKIVEDKSPPMTIN